LHFGVYKWQQPKTNFLVMKKSRNCIKASILVLLFFAFTQQANIRGIIQAALIDFYKNSHQAKVHIIFNQPSYTPGDTAFFKAHLISAGHLLPLKGKNIINLRLYNAAQHLVLHNRILVQDGAGANQLILPDSLNPGGYLLIAYSDTMDESTPDSLFFRRILTVTGANTFISASKSPVQIFPEGGNFLEGFPNAIVVTGLEKGDSVRVMDSLEETVTSFRVSESGMGRFNITPKKHLSYFIETDGQKITLPEPSPNGIGLSITQDESGSMIANLYAHPEFLKQAGNLYLVLSTGDKICQFTPVSFGGNASLSLPVTTKECNFGTGQITVLNPDGTVMAERLIFVNPNPVAAELALNGTEFSPRKPVEVNIEVNDLYGTAPSGETTVTVYKNDLFKDVSHSPSFFENVFFQSDLDNTDISFNYSDFTDEEIDRYLITRKWKRFKWVDLLNKKQKSFAGAKLYYFKGVVLDGNQQPVKDSTAITFWLSNQDIIYEVYTKRDGTFEFPLFMNFADDYVMYAVTSNGKKVMNATVKVDDSTMSIEKFVTTVPGKNPDPYYGFTKLKGQVHQSFSHYTEKTDLRALERQKEEDQVLDSDFVIDVRKYKSFASVTDILKEVVPMVRNKKEAGRNDVRVFMKESAKFAPGSPLYFIDGILTDNTDYFLALDPNLISTIGVVHSAEELARYGILGTNGLIVVDTNIPASAQIIPRGKNTLLIKGINSPVKFNSPQYGPASNPRIPDLRATLFWNPTVRLLDGKGTVNFYTGDDSGEYVIKIEGVTNDGRHFQKEKTFLVKYR
jgi:hypothetical protein